MKTNDSSHYSPLNPIWDLPYDPKGGSGMLKAFIWVYPNEICDETELTEMFLPYQWLETAVNGLEITLEKPEILNALALEEDINLALVEEFKGKQYTINYITK